MYLLRRGLMGPMQWAAVLSMALFLALVACLEVGFRIGRWQSAIDPKLVYGGVGDIETSVFALFGLLLAFSFAGGTSRLDARRQMIVQEANAISTAYQCVDLLPVGDQPEIRQLFREYLDIRLNVYQNLSDRQATEQAMGRVSQLQQEIWSRAVAAGNSTDSSPNIGRLLLPALNEMNGITTARMIALWTHLPGLIFALLVAAALLSALLAGYAIARRKRRSWFHMLLYAAVIAVTFYTVLDLDYPRSGGFIHLDAADQALRQLQKSIR